KSGQRMPDLGVSQVNATLKREAGPGKKPESRDVVAEGFADRILLRELPVGDAELGLTIDHPYFLPAGKASGSFSVELARGSIAPVFLTVDGIGGAVRVRGTGATARLLAESRTARVERIEDGAVLIEGVEPGIYRAELSRDVACSETVRAWEHVLVIAAATVEAAVTNPK